MPTLNDYTTLDPAEVAPATNIEPNAFMFKQVETGANMSQAASNEPITFTEDELDTEPEEWSEYPKIYTTKEILELCEPKLEDQPQPQPPTTQSIYQRVQIGITVATSILEYLKDKSILKYTALLVLIVLANYVGEVVHNSIPILNGIPTIVGTIYLSSLIKAENRKKVLQTLVQYIGAL